MKDWITTFLMTISATVLVWSLIVILVASLGCKKQAPAQPPQQQAPAPTVRVVAFVAPWCEPCKRATLPLSQIVEAGVRVTFVDIDRDPETTRAWNVKSVPTFFLFRPGRKVYKTHSATTLRLLVMKAIRDGEAT